jgi:hypothetical protein
VFWADDAYQRFLEYQWLRGERPGLEVINPLALTRDVPRRRFILRHGIDPFEGVPPPRPNDPYDASRFLDTLYKSLNRRMDQPIFVVQPDGRTIWGMVKPGAPATPRGSGPTPAR